MNKKMLAFFIFFCFVRSAFAVDNYQTLDVITLNVGTAAEYTDRRPLTDNNKEYNSREIPDVTPPEFIPKLMEERILALAVIFNKMAFLKPAGFSYKKLMAITKRTKTSFP